MASLSCYSSLNWSSGTTLDPFHFISFHLNYKTHEFPLVHLSPTLGYLLGYLLESGVQFGRISDPHYPQGEARSPTSHPYPSPVENRQVTGVVTHGAAAAFAALGATQRGPQTHRTGRHRPPQSIWPSWRWLSSQVMELDKILRQKITKSQCSEFLENCIRFLNFFASLLTFK